PSFGRVTVASGVAAGAFFRSSFVTINVKVEDYETFLRNAWAATHGGKAEVAFVDSCRKTLANLEPTNASAAGPAHIALEGLRFGAEAKDAKLAARFFASPTFQLRISAARVLEAAGGAEAADALLRLALNDSDPFVASVAIEALARVRPTPATATKDLAGRLKNLDANSTILRTSPEDPRTNEQPSPLLTAFETLRALGAADEASKVAVEILKRDETEPFMAATLHLAKAKAKDQIPAIIAAFRPADNPYTGFNEKLGELLEELTGKKLGPSKDAWQAWLKNEKK
ncbi:MAG: HEAT repeat domain-containing protein, partial [Planctomycetota bacterium]